jgi:hypothetical protein
MGRDAATGHGDEAPAGGGPPAEARLMQLIDDGAAEWVSLFVAGLPDGEAARLAPLIAARRRRGVPLWQRTAMWVAGACCLPEPEAVARWVVSPTLTALDADAVAVLRVLRERPPRWQGEAAARIAERLPPRAPVHAAWQVCYGLTVMAGGPAPRSAGFLHGWVTAGTEAPERDIRFLLARSGWAEPPRGPRLAERLRVDPFLDAMVAGIFGIDGIGALLSRDAGGWPDALAELAAEGRLERTALFDACLARLELMEKPQHARGIVDVLEALDPDPEDCAARTAIYARLLTGGPRVTAEHAQRVLRTVDQNRLLDSDVVLGTSRAVMQRGGYRLLLRQLNWLDRHARSHPAQAGRCAAVAALGLRGTPLTVWERAADVVANHIGAASQRELAEVLEIVRTADAATKARLGPRLAVHDTVPADAPIADTVPVAELPVYQPTPMLGPLDGPIAVAEEFRAALGTDRVDSPHLERFLAAVVALAAADPAGLAAALRPVRRDLAPDVPARNQGTMFRMALLSLLIVCDTPVPTALRGKLLALSRLRPSRGWFAPDEILHTRIWEAVANLGREPVPAPCLLSTPTGPAGLLDPLVLIERIHRYEAAAATPWPTDVEQALLRLPGSVSGDAVSAARGLSSSTGWIVEYWMANRLHVETPPENPRRRLGRSRQRSGPARGAGSDKTRRAVGAAYRMRFFQLLAQPSSLDTGPAAPDAERPAWSAATMVHWPAVSPCVPDQIASHALPRLREQTRDGHGGAAQMLPELAEAPGAFAARTHEALLLGLAAGAADDRDAAARAFVVLASRGKLDPRELGRRLAGETGLDRDRIRDALRTAGHAGAHEQVAAVLIEAEAARGYRPQLIG